MKRAVLIVMFIFILLGIGQVSAVLVYNSAMSNVCNRIYGDVLENVILLKITESEPMEVTKEIEVDIPRTHICKRHDSPSPTYDR